MNRGIDDLPAHYRAALVLGDVEGLSGAEVAEALGVFIASVKSRLHRARMALREGLTCHLGLRASGGLGTIAADRHHAA